MSISRVISRDLYFKSVISERTHITFACCIHQNLISSFCLETYPRVQATRARRFPYLESPVLALGHGLAFRSSHQSQRETRSYHSYFIHDLSRSKKHLRHNLYSFYPTLGLAESRDHSSDSIFSNSNSKHAVASVCDIITLAQKLSSLHQIYLLTAVKSSTHFDCFHSYSYGSFTSSFGQCYQFHSGDDKTDENLTEDEWTHPDRRSDNILKKDPELKSLLGELASDFGRHNENADLMTGSSESKTIPALRDSKENLTTDGGRLETIAVEKEDDCLLHPDTQEFDKPEKKYVFSIDDLVTILREENVQDICVINIPKERQYVDYFVVVTGRSPRHLKAVTLHVNQQYKSRKNKEHPFLLVEGEETDDWMCLDFGNIVLHLMSDETRELYELEKLWTLGPQFDDQFRRLKEHDNMIKESLTDVGSKVNNDQSQDKESDKHTCSENNRPTSTFTLTR